MIPRNAELDLESDVNRIGSDHELPPLGQFVASLYSRPVVPLAQSSHVLKESGQAAMLSAHEPVLYLVANELVNSHPERVMYSGAIETDSDLRKKVDQHFGIEIGCETTTFAVQAEPITDKPGKFRVTQTASDNQHPPFERQRTLELSGNDYVGIYTSAGKLDFKQVSTMAAPLDTSDTLNIPPIFKK